MHDARELLERQTESTRRLARRGHVLDVAALETAVKERRAALETATRLQTEHKRASKSPRRGADAPDPVDTEALRQRSRELREQVHQAEERQRTAEQALTELLLTIPNLPLDRIPDGNSEKDAEQIRLGGPPVPQIANPRHHAELGEAMGIFDADRSAKLSGARFHVSRGAGAALERALASFFLDLHTQRHGYTEYAVPNLVTRETMTGTGQLPKFEEDLFATRVGQREMFLIPTAEVPLTNLFSGETLNESQLPLALTAHTPCYRGEAGSYGRDTRGILRLHQFGKVELVRVCAADQAQDELERLVSHAEACLAALGLAYRVVLLAAGDMGFSARMTYDIEVWMPSTDSYREVSSCSDCGTFQARRARIRVRGRDGKKGFAATLNGSGLPIGRTLAALLEQHQRPDGSVAIPEVLHPYTGFTSIAADGTPVR